MTSTHPPDGTGVTWGLRPIEGGPSDLPLEPGVPQQILPGVLRVLAPNAGFFTGPGTNTYIVGDETVVVIDAGPEGAVHSDAIAAAVDGRPVAGVVSTHHHVDHAPGAAALAERLGAPTISHPAKLSPDLEVGDGDKLPGLGGAIEVLHTPGHASDHICLLLRSTGTLFSGDHVMGGSTVVITPPDGDMAVYLDSIERLASLDLKTLLPGHGQPVYEPAALLHWYIEHRLEREAQVLEVVGDDPKAIEAMVAEIYDDVPVAAHKVAAFSVWAHLIKLENEGRVKRASGDGTASEWTRAR